MSTGMNFSIAALSQIEESLKSLNCKSYSLDIRFDQDTRIFIEKKPTEKERTIGYNQEGGFNERDKQS